MFPTHTEYYHIKRCSYVVTIPPGVCQLVRSVMRNNKIRFELTNLKDDIDGDNDRQVIDGVRARAAEWAAKSRWHDLFAYRFRSSATSESNSMMIVVSSSIVVVDCCSVDDEDILVAFCEWQIRNVDLEFCWIEIQMNRIANWLVTIRWFAIIFLHIYAIQFIRCTFQLFKQNNY